MCAKESSPGSVSGGAPSGTSGPGTTTLTVRPNEAVFVRARQGAVSTLAMGRRRRGIPLPSS